MTIRDIIEERRTEIGDAKSLTPVRAAEIMVELANLTGNILDQIRKTDIAYNKRLLECYEKEEKANRAKIIAESSPEYEAKREARDTKEVVVELIRSLKYLVKSYEEEQQNYGTS